GNSRNFEVLFEDFFMFGDYGSSVLAGRALYGVHDSFSFSGAARDIHFVDCRSYCVVPGAGLGVPVQRDRRDLWHSNAAAARRGSVRRVMEIAAAISSFLTHVQVEKGLAVNTLSAYRRDLAKFEDFAKRHKLAL